MQKFRDTEGREWNLAVNVAAAKRARDHAGVDVMDLAADATRPEDSLLYKLYADPILMSSAVYQVCRPEAEQRGISEDDFCNAMAGDCLATARDTFIESTIAFFPNPRDRKRATAAIESLRAMIVKAHEILDKKLSSGELEREMEAAMEKTLGKSSTSSPESPA